MKVDAGLDAALRDVPQRIRELEEQGYDAAITAETSHDPFLPLLLAAEHSSRIQLRTGIVVAFARSPMTVAATAHDLQSYSAGRFVLGLGSQIKPHVTKRFSMPWSHPAPRMREFVLALRAIFGAWYQGARLDFRGEFYTHTLMTPFFTPTDTQHGPPKVVIAAVGPLMTEAAGEVADGMIAHAFTTRAYLERVTLPAIERGLASGGRRRGDFELCYPPFVVSGRTEDEMQAVRRDVCRQIAFYGSTPAYRGVLETHGWGELQNELNALSKRGLWEEMGNRISDDVLREIAVVAEPAQLPQALRARCAGIADRVAVRLPFLDPEQRAAVVSALRAPQ